MYSERMQKVKNIAMLILLLTGMILLTNTNNNPNPIIQRIFRPIQLGGGTFYYSGLILIVIIYYVLKEIYKQNDYTFLNTTFRRLVILILLMNMLPSISQGCLKMYKSFSSDLNAIYCNRDNMKYSFGTTDSNKVMVKSEFELENCSSEREEFYVKIDSPKLFKENKEDIVKNTDEVYILNAKERRRFEITFEAVNNFQRTDGYMSVKNFEFTLYNNLQEVKFTKID